MHTLFGTGQVVVCVYFLCIFTNNIHVSLRNSSAEVIKQLRGACAPQDANARLICLQTGIEWKLNGNFYVLRPDSQKISCITALPAVLSQCIVSMPY